MIAAILAIPTLFSGLAMLFAGEFWCANVLPAPLNLVLSGGYKAPSLLCMGLFSRFCIRDHPSFTA
jgi:hypothetical protein